MNLKKILKILGKIMILEGILMIAPLFVSIIYKENIMNIFGFAIPIFILFIGGILLQFLKIENDNLYQKEGFALVALVWIVMAIFGALPFVISGEIPNYIDALFETMSGFTTTGASIINDITEISHSCLFWRSFTHWIGGMGILVFILIFIPESNDGSSMHLLRAESPGPQVGKLVSKMKATTRILYLIYLGLSILELVFLALGKPTPGYESDHIFHCFLTTFGTAGTGGFGFIPGSFELMTPYTHYVVATFLILFGINFSLYYLILIGKIKEVVKSEELKTYFIIFIVAVTIIAGSLILRISDSINLQQYSVEEAFRHSYFQVATIMTTAGFTTTDFNVWPTIAKAIIIALMLFGGMAGSTAGGIKMSRLVIGVKGANKDISKLIKPRQVSKTKFEGKLLSEETVNGVSSFITLYFIILVVIVLLLSFDPVNGTTFTVVSDAGTYTEKHGLLSNITATISALSNVGPGLEGVGPYSSFYFYSPFSKIVLSLGMLIGRLEILPVLILFSPRTWKK